MHARQLTHDELISLTQLANDSDAFTRNRASVILLSAKGKCVAEIADTVGRSQRHVRNLIHSFNANGLQTMFKAKRSGRPCVLSDMQRQALLELLKKQPENFGINRKSWTLQSIADVLQSEGVCENVSIYVLQREMKRLGLSWSELKIRGIARTVEDIDSANRQSSFRRGTYPDRMLRLGERELYDEVIANLQTEYSTKVGNPSLHMQLAAVYSVKLIGAQTNGDWEEAERFDRMMQSHLRHLKSAKKKQEIEEARKTGDTPAEVAANIVEALRKEEAEMAALGGKDNSTYDLDDQDARADF
ncbi:MAG: helix-turn-helix domain-containing protein [Armatimonadota bacterium]